MAILKKITSIKNYKSYINYHWDSLSTHFSNKGNEKEAEFDNGFNVIFGENGSGKSAIVQILKSLSQNGEFVESIPEKVELTFDDYIYLFENDKWKDDKRLDRTDIIFFDADFISTNIHSNGKRETALDKGGHTQHSGKLLIELDGKAKKLRDDYEDSKTKLNDYRTDNKEDLEFNLTEDEKRIYEELKDKNKDELIDIQNSLPEKTKKIQNEIEQLKKNKSNIAEIQSIEEIKTIDKLERLPEEQTIRELYTRDIKEKSTEEAKEETLKRISNFEDFYKAHKDLTISDTCPFCGYNLNTEQAKKMLSIYQNYFDRTYEINKEQYKEDVSKQIKIFESIKAKITSIAPLILSKQKEFGKITDKYAIKNLTIAPEVNSIKTNYFDKIIKELNSLLTQNNPAFSDEVYQKIYKVYQEGKNAISTLNTWITENNTKIEKFKEQNKSETEIDSQISKNNKMLDSLQLKQSFINENKISKYQKALKVKKEEKRLKTALDNAKDAYEEYLKSLPTTTAEKMQDLINNQFSLNFKLIADEPQLGRVKEYPFKFRIVDEGGHERSIHDGLSEGERQIISWAFFFAHMEKLPKQKRIIVFDDPVNSVDARNLKVFVELIEKECKGNQVFLFTHHSLFYKYSTKLLQCSSFGIIKNKEQFGGSFIYREKSLVISDKLKNMSDALKKLIQNKEMNYTIFTLEYGHLLRYAVEDFIKNKLLFWDKKDFTQIINEIGNQNLSEYDLHAIKKIYDFCNWSNHLHPDKEEPASLTELQSYIDKFLGIRNIVK